MLQRGVAGCNGGVVFTTRQGVWEAPSAVAWERVCSDVQVGLMYMGETGRLFDEADPDDVNDFTKLLMRITHGSERVDRWCQR